MAGSSVCLEHGPRHYPKLWNTTQTSYYELRSTATTLATSTARSPTLAQHGQPGITNDPNLPVT